MEKNLIRPPARPEDDITIGKISTKDEMAAYLAVRFAVFCDEQGVDRAIETDERDVLFGDTEHYFVKVKGTTVGTFRCYSLEEAGEKVLHIGRLAFLSDYRGFGLGRSALAFIEARYKKSGIRHFSLDGQCQCQGFYEKCGFLPVSEPFEEAGIPHVKMEKTI